MLLYLILLYGFDSFAFNFELVHTAAWKISLVLTNLSEWRRLFGDTSTDLSMTGVVPL
jgi:hypothetical protein